MSTPEEIVNSNLDKGPIRLVVIIVLLGIVAISGVSYTLYNQKIKDCERCNEELNDCIYGRMQDLNDYIKSINRYNSTMTDTLTEVRNKKPIK